MKILANDGLDAVGIKKFSDKGIEISTRRIKQDDLPNAISEYDGLIVRSATKVTKEVLEAGKNLKIVGRAGVGVENVDVDFASRNGILVKYAPHGNTVSTAELAFGLMLAVSRNIPQAHHSLKNGTWLKKEFEGVELYGRTLGIIGCGRIGRKLAQFARGFDMKVLGYDLQQDPSNGIEYVPKDELLRRSDYVSIHTGGKNVMIGPEELTLMRRTAYLINASRGENIDEAALYAALKEKRIAGAALDTYQGEPKEEGTPFTKQFRDLGNVVLTSHLGASTPQAQEKTSAEIADVVIAYLVRGDWSNAVNIVHVDGEEWHEGFEAYHQGREHEQIYPLFVFHHDAPGVFGQISTVLGKHHINIRSLEGRKLKDTGASIGVCLLSDRPTQQSIEELVMISDVYSVKQ
jgi:D-3-phosphoglycerate dehydrogenase